MKYSCPLRILFVLTLLWCETHTQPALSLENYQKPEVFTFGSKKDSKQKVTFGMFLSTLSRFDPIKRSINASFYVWWRTNDPAYHPDQTVEIVNTPNYKMHWLQKGKVGSEYITLARYSAEIVTAWDVKHFPFDRQKIVISLEDVSNDIDSIELIPDNQYSGISQDLRLGGWILKDCHVRQTAHQYNTNFGNPSHEKKVTSRGSMIIEIKRLGLRIFFNYFIGFLLAGFLCIVSFFIEPVNVIARSNLVLGAIFLTIGNKYIIDQNLPIMPIFTLTDAIQAATFLIITWAVSINVLCYGLYTQERTSLSLCINKILGFVLSVSYLSYISYNIYVAVNS